MEIKLDIKNLFKENDLINSVVYNGTGIYFKYRGIDFEIVSEDEEELLYMNKPAMIQFSNHALNLCVRFVDIDLRFMKAFKTFNVYKDDYLIEMLFVPTIFNDEKWLDEVDRYLIDLYKNINNYDEHLGYIFARELQLKV